MSLDLLHKYHLRPKKSLGQNFLVDDNILDVISSFLSVCACNIIEVGPGYGALTQRIFLHRPESLTVIELDKDMVRILQERQSKGEFSTNEVRFQIIHQDILKYTPMVSPYSVVANIPYYITSPILRHFIYTLEIIPESMMILMQKDVGDKILGYGTQRSSVIRLMVSKKYHVKSIVFVPKTSFVPVPKVDSSVLFFEKHTSYMDIDDTYFMKVIKIGFASKRKKLVTNLVAGGFEKTKVLEVFGCLGIDESIRGEALDTATWCALIKAFKRG